MKYIPRGAHDVSNDIVELILSVEVELGKLLTSS